jgi:RNA polymerase sigma-70 factor (ECF subfamily)
MYMAALAPSESPRESSVIGTSSTQSTPVPSSRSAVDDDRTLAGSAARGDRHAFERLVERYLDRTLRICLRLVGNLEDAEDAVQETFSRAWSKLSSFAGRASFGTWITSIALRLCADVERARKSRQKRGGELPGHLELDRDFTAPRAACPALQSEQRETVRRLEVELARLPPRLRVALTLRTIEGLEYEDVAKSMGTSVRSARLYVWEARQRLARELGLERRRDSRDPRPESSS